MTQRNEALLAWGKTATDAEVDATGTTREYLKQIAWGHKTASVEMAVRIETASRGAATRQQLRPDDWRELWPELNEALPPEPGPSQPSFILESWGPLPGTSFFDNGRSGFPSAEHMLESRLRFEEGASGKLELRFACRPQPFQTLVFCLNGAYLVFDRIDFVRSRAVFSGSGWHRALPSGLAEPVGWLDASGPLPGAPLADDESGSSHAEMHELQARLLSLDAEQARRGGDDLMAELLEARSSLHALQSKQSGCGHRSSPAPLQESSDASA